MFSSSMARCWRHLFLIIAFIAVLLAGGSGSAGAGQAADDGGPRAPFAPLSDDSLTALSGEVLTCNGPAVSFEAGIPPAWTVVDNTGGKGIHWVTTADPACGPGNLTNGSGVAACADSDAAGVPEVPYDTFLWSNTFDLSAWDEVELSFKSYFRDLAGAPDLFRVYIWDGGGWNTMLTWNEDHEPDDITLNLSPYAGLAGLGLAFRYSGDGYDYYAQVDDVSLTCRAFPQIKVSPAMMGLAQPQNSQGKMFIEISNSGKSKLHWQISEATAPDCHPSDVRWLSLSQYQGAAAVGITKRIDVTFNSAGMSPGTYRGLLCISSDDPDPGPGLTTNLALVDIEHIVIQIPPKVYLPVIVRP